MGIFDELKKLTHPYEDEDEELRISRRRPGRSSKVSFRGVSAKSSNYSSSSA